MDTVTPNLTTMETTQENTPKPPTANRHEALPQMQKMDLFCKHISRQLLSGKAPWHEADLFPHVQTHHGYQSEIYGTHHTKSLEVYCIPGST